MPSTTLLYLNKLNALHNSVDIDEIEIQNICTKNRPRVKAIGVLRDKCFTFNENMKAYFEWKHSNGILSALLMNKTAKVRAGYAWARTE